MNYTKKQSSEDYLERILMLQKELNRPVRAIDIANALNFSRASVSIALKKLEQEEMIIYKENQTIELTEEGLKVAEETYERHLIITKALIQIGVDEDIAEDDACKVEHIISEETFKALKRIINKK